MKQAFVLSATDVCMQYRMHNLHCSLFLPMMRLDLMFVADGGDDDADRALFVGFISYIR